MSVDNTNTVDVLFTAPFSIRSEEKNARIISDGRPNPDIKSKSTSQEVASQSKQNLYDELRLRHQKKAVSVQSTVISDSISKMSVDNKNTVDELLVTPFSIRSEEEKVRIITDGRPTPAIKSKVPRDKIQAASQVKQNLYDQLRLRSQKKAISLKSLYDDMPWLTASIGSKNFHCWPCLLFRIPDVLKPEMWHVSGTLNISLVKKAADEHKLSVEHIKAMCQYLMFTNTNVRKENGPSECDIRSLDVIKMLTDVVFTVVSMQLPPRECNNYPCELDTKQCIESLQLLRKYDNINKACAEKAIDLLQNSPHFITNLTKSIAKVMRQTITREVNSSKHVSIILNQHSNVKLKAQISTVLRYVVNGRVRERFVEFNHLFGNATVESLYTYLTKLAKEFNIDSKIVALSVDGAILSSSDVSMLLLKCHHKFPRCVFVPCYSHALDEVLQKSLSSPHTRLEIFFKIMADFHACFWDLNSEFSVAFNRYLSRSKINHLNISPRISSSDWFVASDFIICVQKHRRIFVSFLKEAALIDFKLSSGNITKAIGFREFLSDFLTIFLLGMFSKIFQLTSALNAALSNHSPERIINKKVILTLLNCLSAMEDGNFECLFTDAYKEIGYEALKTNQDKCLTLFKDVLKIVIGEVQMRYRYSHVDKFQFCRLFDFEDDFGQAVIRYNDLSEIYNVDHGLHKMLSEMETISKHESFSKKSVYDFHQYLHESGFKHAFGALFDFSELILALPFKPPFSTKEIPIKEKIDHKCSFGFARKSYYADIDIIFLESDNLIEIQQSQTFYDEVVINMLSEYLTNN